MKTKERRDPFFSPKDALFISMLACVFALGCSIFAVRSEMVTEEAQITPTASKQQEEPEKFLDGLLTIEAARQNPGPESNQTLQDYLATISPSKLKMTHSKAVNSVAFNLNGQWVVSGSDDGTARVWDVSTGHEVASVTIDGSVSAVDFSSDGKWVAQGACEGFSEGIVACGKAIIRVWEAGSGKELYQIRANMALITVKFTPDDSKIIITGNREGVQIWNLDSNTLSSPVKPDRTGAERAGQAGTYIYALDVDPLGRWFATGSVVAVQVWDLKTNQEVSKYPRGSSSLAFSPNGELIASITSDEIRLWNAKTATEVLTRIPVGGYDLEFSPDGNWLAAASGKMVKVWEFPSGKEVSQISFSSGIKSIAFSPDGKWIASGVNDNTVSVSLWNSDDIIAEICSLLPRNFTHSEWKRNFGDEPYGRTCPNLPVPTN